MMNLRRLSLFCLLCVAASAQVFSVTVTAQGANYTTAPTVTSAGGGCIAQPTFLASTNNGALNTITPTFMGLGCTSSPTLTIGGPGTGAAAAVNLLPASIIVLSTVSSQSGTAVVPAAGGIYTAWQFACWLTVPAARVPFYAAGQYRMPGTAQATSWPNAPAGVVSALQSGILTEYIDQAIVVSTIADAVVQAGMVQDCAAQQAALNAWNPWSRFGTVYLNGAWTGVTIQ